MVRFLNSFFFPGQDTLKVVSEYIDFSNNKALKEEVGKMRSIGASIYNDGLKKGWSDGEDKLGKLISYLFKIGKPDEAEQAANDKKKRQELYEKYNIK